MSRLTVNNIENIIKRIPLLSDIPPSNITIKRLTGLTNTNYQLTVSDKNNKGQYVLRVPKTTTNHIINRENEASNTAVAQQLGLSPTVIWRDETQGNTTGISLSTLIINASTLNKKTTIEHLHNIAEHLVTLQTSPPSFKGELNSHTITLYLHEYFDLCTVSQKVQTQEQYLKALETLKCIEAKNLGSKKVPCHGDLVMQNILVDDNKTWFIDWEYSVMASPYWDIATLSHSAALDKETATTLLQHIMPNAGDKEVDTLVQYQFIVEVLEQLWSNAFIDEKH